MYVAFLSSPGCPARKYSNDRIPHSFFMMPRFCGISFGQAGRVEAIFFEAVLPFVFTMLTQERARSITIVSVWDDEYSTRFLGFEVLGCRCLAVGLSGFYGVLNRAFFLSSCESGKFLANEARFCS